MKSEENKIEENRFRDGEIVEKKNLIMKWWKKNKGTKLEFYFEMALFLILGILIGIAVKTEAIKNIAVGFNDYKMKINKQDYDFNKMQANLIERQREETEEQMMEDNNEQNIQEDESIE